MLLHRSKPALGLFTALLLFAATALAQNAGDDSGTFNEGDQGPADNADSEAVPGLAMSLPEYGGNGCPQGTVSATLSPDQRTLSVLFDAHIARAGGATAQPRGVSECTLSIPFQVPPGYKVSIVKMDYRGFAHVPGAGGRATFSAGFRFMDQNGSVHSGRRVMRAKAFQGPLEKEIDLSARIVGSHWSPCGQNFKISAESRLLVQSNSAQEDALAALDSLDVSDEPVTYHLKWKKCNPANEPPPPRTGPNPPRRPLPPGPPRGRPQDHKRAPIDLYSSLPAASGIRNVGFTDAR